MRAPGVLLTLLVAGCGAVAPLATPIPPPPPPEPVSAVQPIPQAAAVVTNHFHRAVARERDVVLAPEVTPEQIDRIRLAHRRSSTALDVLARQGTHITAAAQAEARDAVKELEDALAEQP